MKAKHIRVFVAHSKQDSDAFIEGAKERIETTLRNAAIAQGKAVVIECVLGRDDHAAHFKAAGSWDAWAYDVVDRIDYVTRDPVYAVIVVTSAAVGAATAKMVERALARTRPILLFCDDSTLRPIRELRHVSSDFKAGWEVVAS